MYIHAHVYQFVCIAAGYALYTSSHGHLHVLSLFLSPSGLRFPLSHPLSLFPLPSPSLFLQPTHVDQTLGKELEVVSEKYYRQDSSAATDKGVCMYM